MAERFYEVQAQVRLDFTEADRRLREIEEKIGRSRLHAKEAQKIAPTNGKLVRAAPARETGKTPVEIERRLESTLLNKLRTAALSNPAVGAASRAAGFLPGAQAALKTIAPTAVGYGAISLGAQIAPTVAAFAKEFLPAAIADSPAMRAVEGKLEALRNVFATFESGVTSLFSAVSKTSEMAVAGARLTGQFPDMAYYFDQSMKLDSSQSILAKKFREFQRNEFASAMGRSMNGYLKESLSR